MHSTRTLLAVASITSCLTHGAEGFLVSLYNTIPSQQQLHTTRLGSRRCTRTRGTAAPGQHDSTTTTAVTSLSRRLCHTHLHTRTNSGLVVMAAAAKKRRRRKDTPSTPPSDNNKESAKSAPSPPEPAAVTPSAKAEGEAPESASGDESKAKERGEATRALVEVQQGMRPVTDLFTDDWSGMQANDGMVKSKVGRRCGIVIPSITDGLGQVVTKSTCTTLGLCTTVSCRCLNRPVRLFQRASWRMINRLKQGGCSMQGSRFVFFLRRERGNLTQHLTAHGSLHILLLILNPGNYVSSTFMPSLFSLPITSWC